MKRLFTVAAVAIGAAIAPIALAQSTPPADIPKPQCNKPVMPGTRMMEEPSVRRRFQGDIDAYKKCMKDYSDARNAVAKAHIDAANEAINDYNATIKSLQDAQKGS
jgi:hypothetical protein